MVRRFRLTLFVVLGLVLASSMAQPSLEQQGLELCDEADMLTSNADGSFYYSSDLRYRNDLDELNAWMTRLNDVLAAKGTLLVVVPTPLRGMVNGEVVTEPEALKVIGRAFDVAEARASYREYVASLAPIFAVDLLDAATSLNGAAVGYHFKLDRHWTPEGAQVSAQAVAQALLDSPAYEVVQATEFVTTAQGSTLAPNGVFEAIEEACGALPDELMEAMSVYETRRAQDSTELFAAEVLPIALVGSSFSGEKYNFAGFLSEALGQEVVSHFVPGGGFFTSLQKLLLDQAGTSEPRVILWEFRMSDAYGTSNREEFTPFREMIPSVYGACSEEESLLWNRVEVSGPRVSLLENPSNPDLYGESYYLHLQASDLSLVEFEIETHHEDGSTDTAPIDHSTRVRNTGSFFLELSRDNPSPLREIVLNMPEDTEGSIETSVCRAPV